MVDRNARNYNSLRIFCVNRDNDLTEILHEVPQWKVSTYFNNIFSTATKWAKYPEEDRIKLFLAYLMPSSIKGKITEHYDETKVFRRKGQAITMHINRMHYNLLDQWIIVEFNALTKHDIKLK